MRLLRKHPATLSLSSLVPALFVLGLLAGPVAGCLSAPLALAFAGALALYAVVVLGASLAVAARPGKRRLLPWLPGVFLMIHLGCGWGLLREALSGLRRNPPATSATDPRPLAAAE
jgi:hypothetical protein